VEFVDLAIDDSPRLFRFFLAIGDVRTDGLLEIVYVVNKDASILFISGSTSRGHGNIDKEHGLVLAQRHELSPCSG